jgi:GAF domain-containing protein
MKLWINWLYDTSRYPGLLDKDRARMIYGFSSIIIVLVAFFLIAYRDILVGPNTVQNISSSTLVVFYLAAFLGLNIASIVLLRTGRIDAASAALVIGCGLSLGLGTAERGMYSPLSGMILLILIVLSGLLLQIRGLVLGLALTIFSYILGLIARANVPRPQTTNSQADFITGVVIMLAFAGLIYLFLRFSRLNREEGLNETLQDRLKLAEISTQITQRISSRMALTDVLNNAIEQIIASYPDIYHAQIFLVDASGQKARLSASTGEVGKLLLERQHSLEVGSQSVIGRVTLQGTPIVARASSSDSVHRRNEFLPDTVVEAAFPLRIGKSITGVLDLQSKISSAFQDRDLPVFQTLADHLAISIDNARLFEETEERLEENRHLVEQSRSALREVERLNRRLTGHAWSEFLRDQPDDSMSLSINFDDNAISQAAEWTPGLEGAVESNQLVHQKRDQQRVIAAPLRVRGQVVGAMEFELDEEGNLSPEDIDLVEEISERFGLAVENARLYEQSQRSAQRESLINEIAGRLQSTNNVETTLSEAAQSLKKMLKANKVSIRLGPPPVSNVGKDGGQ